MATNLQICLFSHHIYKQMFSCTSYVLFHFFQLIIISSHIYQMFYKLLLPFLLSLPSVAFSLSFASPHRSRYNKIKWTNLGLKTLQEDDRYSVAIFLILQKIFSLIIVPLFLSLFGRTPILKTLLLEEGHLLKRIFNIQLIGHRFY